MRKRSVLFLALTAALVLSACGFGAAPEPPAGADSQPAPTDTSAAGSSGAPTTGAASTVTITFGASSFMRHAYEPLIDAFNAQHPGITVQFVALDEVYRAGSDYNEQTRQIVSLADTAEAGANEEQFRLGLLNDLAPLIDADPSFNRDDFYPSALSSATTASGAVYQLPQTLDVQLLFYNKDLWAARNLAAPKPDWTWQDVEAAAQQLAQKRGNTVTIYGVADEQTYLAVLLTELKSAGLDLLSTPPANAHVDRPEVAGSLERMANLFKSGAFFFPPEGADFRDAVAQLVLDQQVAAWGSNVAGDIAARLQKQNGGSSGATTSLSTGVALYPPLPGGTREKSSGYIMSSGTQHPQEAWAWLSFLSTQLISNQNGGKGGPSDAMNVLPARKSLAEQSGYWSRLDAETRTAVQAALDRPAPASSSVNLDSYEPLIQAIQDIIGGKSAAQAASEAQAAIANLVAQAQQTPTAAPNTAPVVVATPVPNVAPADATTITFAMPLVKGGDQASRLVQQFNQSNQGVFVQLKDTFTGNDIMPVPEVAAQADCFTSPFSPAFTGAPTATLDLQPLIDADPSFQLDDYPAALLAPYRQGNLLHGLPWGVDFRVLVYNQNLFDAAGLRLPTADWTIDDFLGAAQKLTAGEGDIRQYGFVIPRSPSQAVKFLVHLFGVATAQGSGETLKPNFTDPNVVQAVRKVVDLLKHETPHTRLNDYASSPDADYGPLTGEGRAGMWFAWGLYAYGQERPQFTLAMAPPPLAQAALDTDDIWTSSMYISARTDKQQACWTWLKYFSMSTIPGASNFPARRSAAQSDALNQAQPGMAAVYQAYVAALDRAGQLAPGGDAPGVLSIDYYWFYRAIDQALQGKDLERELAEAQALTEQYVACMRSGGQRETCTQQVDPNYGQY
jgi:ABC-type glycerol-3-phosphate transport system substrate-binding protein